MNEQDQKQIKLLVISKRKAEFQAAKRVRKQQELAQKSQ